MSKYIVDSSLMTGIADNIRLKTGEEGNLVFPTGFNAAIESLPSIEDMRDIKDKVDDIKDIFDSNESEIDKTITTPVDIASFSDGANDASMALTVAVEPAQDLHGYDNPWPAGGGKQLIPYPYKDTLPLTKNGVTFTDIGNGRVHAQGTATSTTYLFLYGGSTTPIPEWIKPNTEYTLRPISVASKYFVQFILYGSTAYALTGSTFTTPSDFSNYTGFGTVIGINNGAVVNDDISPMLEYGSTASDWQPYENICPISGWTGCNVWDDPAYAGTIRLNQIFPLKNGEYAGTNFTVSFDGAGCMTVDVTATASSTNANNFSSLGAGTWIKGHIYAYIGGAHGINLRLKGYGKDIDSVFRVNDPLYNNLAIVFTNLAVGVYKVYPMIIDLTAMFGEAKAEEILSLGSVAGAEYVKSLLPKEYYPYNVDSTETCISAANGNPYRNIEVAFPSSAGTVYGGSLTINQDGSGALVVDKAYLNAADATWSDAGSGRVYTALPLSPTELTTVLCSHCEYHRRPGIGEYANWIDWGGYPSSNRNLIVTMEGITDTLSAWNTYIQSNNVEFMYCLESSVTYELTDLEVIETLKGINNIWADTGKINEVEYSADSQLCITNKLNELDSLLSTYTETQA